MRILLMLLALTATVEDKLLYVPVVVNGKGPFWFCLDSGAPHTVVDPFVVKQLGMTVKSSSSTPGTGQGDVPVGHVGAVDMRIGSARLHIEDPWVIDLAGVPIRKETHGLVGEDWLEKYVVRIDSNAPSLTFFDPKTFTPPASAVKIPIENADHRLFIRVQIDVTAAEHVERRVRIDTGSGESVSDESLKRGHDVRQTTLGNGLGANFAGYSGKVDAVHIGPFVVREVWGPADRPAIGMEMLRRFVVTFDVPHGCMYLQPNGHLREAVPAPE